MIEKEIDQNAFDVVLRDIRLKVCDCVALVREDSAVLRIAFPCLNLSWSALPVEVVGPSGDQFLVTDGGQVLRQLQRSASNEEICNCGRPPSSSAWSKPPPTTAASAR
jgi:hypothetical protein